MTSDARVAPEQPAVPLPGERGRHLQRPHRPHVSLASRFLLANLTILMVGALAMGIWVGDQLEQGIVGRAGSMSALYVSSLIEPHVDSLNSSGSLAPADQAELDALLGSTTLGDRIVSMRIWSPDGVVRYSPDRGLIGKSFPPSGDFAAAAAGQVVARLSDLSGSENVIERQHWSRLFEMYVPVREPGSDAVMAVAEFYQLPDAIDAEVASARLASWAVVGLGVLLSFLLLYGIVKRASDTIRRQERALVTQVEELSALAERNATLTRHIRKAAERATTLNELALRRIGSDLHDGPGQMVSLALLRLGTLRPTGRSSQGTPEAGGDAHPTSSDDDYREVEGALTDALRELRSIAAGLRLPELTAMGPEDVASRAVSDHVRRTGTPVGLSVDGCPERLAMPVKIALFRALQELLSNATRHGHGKGVHVLLAADVQRLTLAVSDAGPGFDASRLGDATGLGLAGIHEQAELLGGGSEVRSGRGAGTAVRVWWPLPPASSTDSQTPSR
jgi:signal transduction histidine kinase